MLVVTPAESGHAEALAALLAEMGEFYGAAGTSPPEPPEPLEQRARQVRQVLFDDVRGISALLAWDDTQLAGLAAYSFLWPAIGLTRSLYLKELYAGLGAAVRTSKLFYRVELGLHDSS